MDLLFILQSNNHISALVGNCFKCLFPQLNYSLASSAVFPCCYCFWSLCRVQLFCNLPPRSVAHQAPLSMGFSRQEYWGGLPFSTPGDLSNPGTRPTSPALAGGFFTTKPPGKHFSYK